VRESFGESPSRQMTKRSKIGPAPRCRNFRESEPQVAKASLNQKPILFLARRGIGPMPPKSASIKRQVDGSRTAETLSISRFLGPISPPHICF
jgi:hypothetical protein